jgi:hypothetical protein
VEENNFQAGNQNPPCAMTFSKLEIKIVHYGIAHAICRAFPLMFFLPSDLQEGKNRK